MRRCSLFFGSGRSGHDSKTLIFNTEEVVRRVLVVDDFVAAVPDAAVLTFWRCSGIASGPRFSNAIIGRDTALPVYVTVVDCDFARDLGNSALATHHVFRPSPPP